MKKSKLLKTLLLITVILSIFSVNTYAAPAGVDTSKMDVLNKIVWWIVRIGIGAAGGIPACFKIVQGQADENPRERNGGITLLVITGAVFGGTFAIQALF